MNFVPDSFDVPQKLTTNKFVLKPLTVEMCAMDYEAVMADPDLIRGSYRDQPEWPPADMTLAQNLKDLQDHEGEVTTRRAFTYSVLSPDESHCVGCVYIYPSQSPDFDADIFMWTTTIDRYPVLFATVRDWVIHAWPFKKVQYLQNDNFTRVNPL